MAIAQSTATFKITSNAAVWMYSGTPSARKIRGLQSIALPFGFESETVTVSEMGVRIDIKVPVGGSYSTLAIDYNWAQGDKSQTALQNASLNATEIKDMRFYVDDSLKCGNFGALDLISDPNGAYRIGTFGNPAGDKNALFSGSLNIEPGGPSTLFCVHAYGTDLTFTAGAVDTAATIAATTQDFIELGFEVGDTVIIDYAPGVEEQLYVQIAEIAAKLITCTIGVGDNAKVPTGQGVVASVGKDDVGTTAIHGATPVKASASADLCA